MVCHNSNKNIKGFSIIELLIVIAIFGIFFAITTNIYSETRSANDLKIATNSVVEAVRFAQSNAQVQRGDSSWGLEIASNQLVIFKGNTYASRDTSADQPYNLPKGVTASGLSEIVFAKLDGGTTNTGTITLTNSNGSINILINEKGTITY